MSEKDIQWLSYHFNVEYMFHIALEQLQHIDNYDETHQDDSILINCSRLSNKAEDKSDGKKIKYLFNFTIYLWTSLIIWVIFQIWNSSYYFKLLF